MAHLAFDALPLQPYVQSALNFYTVRPKRLEPGLLYNTSLTEGGQKWSILALHNLWMAPYLIRRVTPRRMSEAVRFPKKIRVISLPCDLCL